MEVATLDGSTSRISVGVIGLMEVMALSGDSGFTDVTVVIGVRGWGLTMVHTEEEEAPSFFSISVSFSMASELRMTRKCVLSDGVMVTVLSCSGFSFLVTWMSDVRRYYDAKRTDNCFEFYEVEMFYPSCFWKLSPGPLHVGLGSEQTL